MQGLSKMPHRHDGQVEFPGLEATDICLVNIETGRECLLREPRASPRLPYVCADDPPNIHWRMAGILRAARHVLKHILDTATAESNGETP